MQVGPGGPTMSTRACAWAHGWPEGSARGGMRHARRLAGTEGRLRHARVTRGLVSESRDSRSPGGTRVGRAGW